MLAIHQNSLRVTVTSWTSLHNPCALPGFSDTNKTHVRVYDQVMQVVKDKLTASVLDAGDSCLVLMKVQDTIESAIKYWQIGHEMDMLIMYKITHVGEQV